MPGKHTTTCKAGRKTLNQIEKIPGVKKVIIGRSLGGKGLHQGRDGMIRLQTSLPGAISAVMQTSKGVQNITILLETGVDDAALRTLIQKQLT